MKKVLCVALTCLTLCALTRPAQAQDSADITLRPIALQIVDPALEAPAAEMAPMNVRPGTTLTLLLRSPAEERIVSLDVKASHIDRFEDAAGTNLLEPIETASAQAATTRPSGEAPAKQLMDTGRQGPIGAFPDVSRDGRRAALEVTAPRAPTDGSGALKLAGALRVRLAAGTKTHTVENVALSAGELDIPARSIEITELTPSDWGQSQMNVTFKMSRGTAERLAKVRFLDDEGDVIKSQRLSKMPLLNEATLRYGLAQRMKSATIEFTFHDQMREVDVPLDMSVSMGL